MSTSVIKNVAKNQECGGSTSAQEISQRWGKVWSRMSRQGYSVSQLEMIIGESKVEAQLIGAALIWASLNPVEEVFEVAAELAGENTIDELWGAYYSAVTRKAFVGVVLAIVHYELLVELQGGEYYPWIEVKCEGEKYVRTYPNPKKK